MRSAITTENTTALGMIIAALGAAKDRPIVERRGRWYTGQNLLDRIYARAADLQSVGFRKSGMAVIIVSDNLIAIEQLLACWIIGGAGACVDFRTPPVRITESVAQLDASLVIGLKQLDGVAMHIQTVSPKIGDQQVQTSNVSPDSIAIHFASSGTTGPPRFTPSTQSRLGTNIKTTNQARDWDVPGAALSAISVGYSASCFLWLSKLSEGKPIVALDLVHRLSELDNSLKRPDVSEAGLAPAQIRKLLEIAQSNSQPTTHRYPQLTNLCSVGGPANQAEKHGAVMRLSKSYRMTYSAVGIGKIARILGVDIEQKPASVGRPEAHLDVRIYDGDRLCGVGEIGEISVSNDVFDDKRPGDMGYFDADGYLYITGRVQGLLCRNGVNFNAQRLIEAVLDHDMIANAEVVSKPDRDQGDIVYLVVEARQSDVASIWTAVRKRIPVAEHPDHIIAVDAIPITASLKNDLPALRSIIQELGDDH